MSNVSCVKTITGGSRNKIWMYLGGRLVSIIWIDRSKCRIVIRTLSTLPDEVLVSMAKKCLSNRLINSLKRGYYDIVIER